MSTNTETTQATIADAAIRHLEAAHPWWVEEGTWSVWEAPELHPGGVTLQVCISGGPERDEQTRAWGAEILASVGWATTVIPATAPGHMPYILAYPPTVVVTRHTALVEWLEEQQIIGVRASVLAHVDDVEQIRGKHVIGVLPLVLAMETACITEVALTLPPGAYGRDLPLWELRPYIHGVRRYQVRPWVLGPPGSRPDVLTAPYPAALDWLQTLWPGLPTIERATAENITGQRVATLLSLPLHLAVHAASVTACRLDLLAAQRGQPLTVADLATAYRGEATVRVRG